MNYDQQIAALTAAFERLAQRVGNDVKQLAAAYGELQQAHKQLQQEHNQLKLAIGRVTVPAAVVRGFYPSAADAVVNSKVVSSPMLPATGPAPSVGPAPAVEQGSADDLFYAGEDD